MSCDIFSPKGNAQKTSGNLTVIRKTRGSPSNSYVSQKSAKQLKQKNENLIDVFLQRCRIQALKCRCRDKAESDERIIQQLVVGNKHKKIRQERLLKKGEDLNLDVAIDMARTYEATHIATRAASWRA